MAKQTVNLGSSANDGTGDPLRTAFDKINDNFDELYLYSTAATGNNITITGNTIASDDTNGNIILDPNGTGEVRLNVTTQLTVGAAGAAAAVPATPTTYIQINVNGTTYVVPAFAVS